MPLVMEQQSSPIETIIPQSVTLKLPNNCLNSPVATSFNPSIRPISTTDSSSSIIISYNTNLPTNDKVVQNLPKVSSTTAVIDPITVPINDKKVPNSIPDTPVEQQLLIADTELQGHKARQETTEMPNQRGKKNKIRPPKSCLKHDQAVNINVSIGLFRYQIMTLFLAKDPEPTILFLITNFAKNTQAIRPNRSFPRSKKITKNRNLITQTNFRKNG